MTTSLDPDLKSRTRADYKFFLTYRTRWSDNDQYSHLNNSIYYHLFDSIINTYLITHCNLSPTTPSPPPSPLIGLVVSSSCQFFAPLSFPQVLELGLRVNKVGRTAVTYEVGVFKFEFDAQERTDSGVAAAVGGYTHVFVDRETRRSLGPNGALGKELREGLERLLVVGEDNSEKVFAKL